MSLQPFHELLQAAVAKLRALEEKVNFHITKLAEETADAEVTHKKNLASLRQLSRVRTANCRVFGGHGCAH